MKKNEISVLLIDTTNLVAKMIRLPDPAFHEGVFSDRLRQSLDVEEVDYWLETPLGDSNVMFMNPQAIEKMMNGDTPVFRIVDYTEPLIGNAVITGPLSNGYPTSIGDVEYDVRFMKAGNILQHMDLHII